MVASKNEITGRWTLEGVEPSEETFKRICEMLKQGENFKFARYGDGEFFCMSGKVGKNCDKHEYFPDLGVKLNQAFYSDPEYMVGIQPLSVHGGLYQKANIKNNGPKNIYDADVLHSASIDGKIDLFFEALKNRSVLLVGSKELIKLAIKNDWQYIGLSEFNCWNDHYRVRKEIEKHAIDVVLLCASMMSEVLIDNFENSDLTIIDCGSVFDPYVGKLSRSYHYKLKI